MKLYNYYQQCTCTYKSLTRMYNDKRANKNMSDINLIYWIKTYTCTLFYIHSNKYEHVYCLLNNKFRTPPIIRLSMML